MVFWLFIFSAILIIDNILHPVATLPVTVSNVATRKKEIRTEKRMKEIYEEQGSDQFGKWWNDSQAIRKETKFKSALSLNVKSLNGICHHGAAFYRFFFSCCIFFSIFFFAIYYIVYFVRFLLRQFIRIMYLSSISHLFCSLSFFPLSLSFHWFAGWSKASSEFIVIA